jgi:alpha-L-rhamnosidase
MVGLPLMKTMNKLLFITALSIFLAYSTNAQTWVTQLTCDHHKNPLGLENTHPKLSWIIKSKKDGQRQTAYHIIASSSVENLNKNIGDVWNTGKITSDRSILIPYEGKSLTSRDRVYWKVKIWDKNDDASPWSETAGFEMGLLKNVAWNASWIKHPEHDNTLHESTPAPHFRKEFIIDQQMKSARTYISGLGYFKLFINGHKVGNHKLDPVKTAYNKTVKYVTFDVTKHLKPGRNTIGVILGTGWYNHFAQAVWGFNDAPWRDYPVLKCQTEIEFKDGTSKQIISDKSWKASMGPIIFDGIRNGEYYDARLEMPGWNRPDYYDGDWQQVMIDSGPDGELSSQLLPPIREADVITPKSITEIKPGVYVFDLGQNIAGYSRIKVAGPKGTEIKLKHGEKLYPDGSVEQKQILRFLKSGEAQTDKYILKGSGIETWNPSFVYHGFQYVEVTGLPVKPTKETLTGVVLKTDFDETGYFACSDSMLNKIQENTKWSFIGNYHGIPTDCPHREKIGWSGDGHLAAEAGLYNYEVVSSYLKWMNDFNDAQLKNGKLPGIVPTSGWGYEFGRGEKRSKGYGPHWEGAFIYMTWYMYEFTGDTSIIAKYFPMTLEYLHHLERISENYLLTHGIDDHKPVVTKTEGAILSTSHFYEFTRIAANMASLLNRNETASDLKNMAEKIKKAYYKEFYHRKDKTFGNKGQTALSGAIYHELVEEDIKEEIMNNLISKISAQDTTFDVGVVGLKYLFNLLHREDYSNLLYKMVTHREIPGFGYWIEQGATTLWQDWDGSMSLNHIMFGSVSEWFFESLAGIQRDATKPGFKNIIIKPDFIQQLTWVAAETKTPYGKVVVNWHLNKHEYHLKVYVPVNTSASIYIPVNNPDNIEYGSPDHAMTPYAELFDDQYSRLNVKAGWHHVIFKKNNMTVYTNEP